MQYHDIDHFSHLNAVEDTKHHCYDEVWCIGLCNVGNETCAYSKDSYHSMLKTERVVVEAYFTICVDCYDAGRMDVDGYTIKLCEHDA